MNEVPAIDELIFNYRKGFRLVLGGLFYFMTIIKPEKVKRVSCVYKMTIDGSKFYIGSTIDLMGRIQKHLYKIKLKKSTKAIMEAVMPDSVIHFEVLNTVEDLSSLRYAEESELLKNIENGNCLNVRSKVFFSLEPGTRGKVKVAKLNSTGDIIEIFPSIMAAASEAKTRPSEITNIFKGLGKTKRGFAYARVDDSGQLLPNYVRPPKKRGKLKGPSKRSKPINKIDANGVIVETFPYLTVAANWRKQAVKRITAVLRGKAKTYHGFHYKYA